jgi:hypothetical protein
MLRSNRFDELLLNALSILFLLEIDNIFVAIRDAIHPSEAEVRIPKRWAPLLEFEKLDLGEPQDIMQVCIEGFLQPFFRRFPVFQKLCIIKLFMDSLKDADRTLPYFFWIFCNGVVTVMLSVLVFGYYFFMGVGMPMLLLLVFIQFILKLGPNMAAVGLWLSRRMQACLCQSDQNLALRRDVAPTSPQEDMDTEECPLSPRH